MAKKAAKKLAPKKAAPKKSAKKAAPKKQAPETKTVKENLLKKANAIPNDILRQREIARINNLFK
jgi:hypothetical protein